MITTAGPEVYIDATIFLGATLGATAAALVPYWAKLRNNIALGLPPITFDKMFVGTLLMALAIGVVVAFISFSVISQQITSDMTYVQVFVVAALAAVTSNRWLNSYLSVSPLVPQVNELKKEVENLKDELNVSKLADAAGKHPIMNELKDLEEGGGGEEASTTTTKDGGGEVVT